MSGSTSEAADNLAGSSSNSTPLALHHSDIRLLAGHLIRKSSTAALAQFDDGTRLLSSGVAYGTSASSTHRGIQRRILNQRATGNISRDTLRLLLSRGIAGEAISGFPHRL